MTRLVMDEFFAGATGALVDAQLELDERGRDSIEGFGDSGVPPTSFAWARCRLRCPVSVGFAPRAAAGERTRATLAPRGSGTVTLALRYLLSPQGGDDPAPILPEERAWWFDGTPGREEGP
jgi:hypothetical protein